VSAGLVLRGEAGRLEPGEEAPAAFARVLTRYPTLAEQFAKARPVESVRHVPRLPHRLRHAMGKGWFLLPHTFAFFDPLFSTGMAWSLLAVERLEQLLAGRHGSPKAYGRLLEREAGQVGTLVEAAHLAMKDFPLFRSICSLYFAAVSHEELRQRLLDPDSDTPRAWRGFLGTDELRLRRLFREVLGHLRRRRVASDSGSSAALRALIEEEIRPYDLVGLDLEERRHLHPVDLDLLLERSHLLGLSRGEMKGRLHRLRGDGA
jgi:FADH2 O2-dependent halogenase